MNFSKLAVLAVTYICFCACKPSFTLKYQDREVAVKDTFRVAIIGNSITVHPPLPDIGWNDNWGMAASAREKDFVHQLFERIKAHEKIQGKCSMKFDNKAAFEARFIEYDAQLIEKQFKDFKEYKPHLLIFRWGDNVTDSVAVRHNFQKTFDLLIQYFRSKPSKQPMMIVTGAWYDKPNVNIQLKNVCDTYNIPYVSLDGLRWTPGLVADHGKFTNGGVASHPSDKGMQVIADSLYNTFEKMIPTDTLTSK